MAADLPLNTIPPSKPHSHTVIFLHNNHTCARDTINQLHEATDLGWRSIIQNFASTRWVFPQASTNDPLVPSMLSISTGIQHAVQRGEPSWWTTDTGDGDEASQQSNMVSGLQERIKQLQKVIRNEVTMLGGRWDKLILGGIGRGGGMAMWTLISLGATARDEASEMAENATVDPRCLGCFVGLSCEMPLADMPLHLAQKLILPDSTVPPADNEALRATPMMLQYFRNGGDAYVQRGKDLCEIFVENNVNVCWKEYEDGWPSLNSPRGVEDMKDFFKDTMDMKPNW